MNAVNEENRRTFAALGEGNTPVAPLEATLFTANQIGELIDALPRESVVSSGNSEQGAARQKNLSPGSRVLVDALVDAVVVLHHTSLNQSGKVAAGAVKKSA